MPGPSLLLLILVALIAGAWLATITWGLQRLGGRRGPTREREPRSTSVVAPART